MAGRLSFDERKSGKYVTKNFNVKGGETVVTPAGTFENCLRVSFDFQAWGYFSGRSEYLFADGVGIVRFEHPYGEDKCAVWQLTEYKGTGKGFSPPTTDFSADMKQTLFPTVGTALSNTHSTKTKPALSCSKTLSAIRTERTTRK